MIWTLLATCVLVIFYILVRDDNIGLILTGAAIAIIIFFGGNAIVGSTTVPTYQAPEVYELASLHNESQLEGSFFLGTGTLEDRQVIFYCYAENNGWKLTSVEADIAIIYEEGRGDGELILHKPTLLSNLLSIYYDDCYEFYIPEGSIIREYSIK